MTALKYIVFLKFIKKMLVPRMIINIHIINIFKNSFHVNFKEKYKFS